MKIQGLIKYGEPLQEVEVPTPEPQGSQILIEVTHAGVCHSDAHIHDGYFALGGDEKLDLTQARELPFALGHEIEGTVKAVGPDVKKVKVGDHGIVYPWIGCGECNVCGRGDEHLCVMGTVLGVAWHGGFATHCLVPHERYLMDSKGIAPGLAATYMCSGLTAYGALKKLRTAVSAEERILIVGLGGLGMMGLQFALELFETPPIVADIDENKIQAAMGAGAHAAYDAKDEATLGKIMMDTEGGVAGAVDFVGSEASLKIAEGSLRRGGDVIVVGLFGGAYQNAIPMFPLRAISVRGSFVASYSDTQEMLSLVKKGKIDPIPIDTRPMSAASQALDDLRSGNVMGRVVLKN